MHFIFTGTESTFKSSLSERVAAELHLDHAPEFARTFLEDQKSEIDFENFPKTLFHEIVQGQLATEQAYQYFDPISKTCIFDTDHLTLEIWGQDAWNDSSPILKTVLQHNIYLLCAPNTTWVDDGMRVDKHRRFALHEKYIQLLEETNAKYHVLTGETYDERLTEARNIITGHLNIRPRG